MCDNTVTEDLTKEETKHMDANTPKIQLIPIEKTKHKLNVSDLIKITEKQTLEIRNLKYQLQDKDFEIQKLQFEDIQNVRTIQILWTRLKEYRAKLRNVMTNEIGNMLPTKEDVHKSVKYDEQNVTESLIEKLKLLEEKVSKMDEKIVNTNQLVINTDLKSNLTFEEIDKKISDMDEKVIDANNLAAKTDINLQNISLMFEKQKETTEIKLKNIGEKTENINKSATELEKVYEEKFGSLKTALTNNIEKITATKGFVTKANLDEVVQKINLALNEKSEELRKLKKMADDLNKTMEDFNLKVKNFGDEISEKGKSVKKTNNHKCEPQLIIPGLKDEVLKCNSSGNWIPCKTLLEQKLRKNSSAYSELKNVGNDFSPAIFALRGCVHMIAVLLANGLPMNHTSTVSLTKNYLDCKGTLTLYYRNLQFTEYGLLHCATENGHVDLVEYLLSEGADTEMRQCNGKTALHLAVEHGYLDIVKLLVENNCDIDAKDMNLKTPLHIAAQMSHIEVVEYLLQSGCNVKVRDSNGKRASDVATSIEVKRTITYQEYSLTV